MRRLLIAFALCAVLLPGVALANDASCKCYCGTASTGAVSKGTIADQTACKASCDDDNTEFVGCFSPTDSSTYPEKSDICWTQEQCRDDDSTNTWEDKVVDCTDSPVKMGHCYSAPIAVNVMTAINGETKFTGVADYVNAIYQLLIPAMAIVAVVMIMIAGLQYILARGNPNGIKVAKQRMANAVIGMVLLMSAYALANLLDPSLTHIKQLRVPKVKEVVMLSEEEKCWYLSSLGLEIDGMTPDKFNDRACKTTGKVTGVDGASDKLNTAGLMGYECTYTKCDGGGTCTALGCGSCRQAAAFGLTPSEDVCYSLEAPDDITLPEYGKAHYCEYIPDNGGTCISAESNPNDLGVNCTAMRSGNDSIGWGGCRDYDAVDVWGYGVNQGDIDSHTESLELLQRICELDPCGLGGDADETKGAWKGGQGCTMSTYTTGNCVGWFDSITTDGAGGTCYDRHGNIISCAPTPR